MANAPLRDRISLTYDRKLSNWKRERYPKKAAVYFASHLK
jgi:hypothetical protein